MTGEKEFIQGQAEPQQSNPVAIAEVESGLTLDWDLTQIATSLGIDPRFAGALMLNKTVTTTLIAAWLAKHGFTHEFDKRGGHLLTSLNNGACYRPVLAIHDLTLAPSGPGRKVRFNPWVPHPKPKTVHGWAAVFSCDLPTAPIYFVSNSLVERMKQTALLDHSYKGKLGKARDFIMKAMDEGQGAV